MKEQKTPSSLHPRERRHHTEQMPTMEHSTAIGRREGDLQAMSLGLEL